MSCLIPSSPWPPPQISFLTQYNIYNITGFHSFHTLKIVWFQTSVWRIPWLKFALFLPSISFIYHFIYILHFWLHCSFKLNCYISKRNNKTSFLFQNRQAIATTWNFWMHLSIILTVLHTLSINHHFVYRFYRIPNNHNYQTHRQHPHRPSNHTAYEAL